MQQWIHISCKKITQQIILDDLDAIVPAVDILSFIHAGTIQGKIMHHCIMLRIAIDHQLKLRITHDLVAIVPVVDILSIIHAGTIQGKIMHHQIMLWIAMDHQLKLRITHDLVARGRREWFDILTAIRGISNVSQIISDTLKRWFYLDGLWNRDLEKIMDFSAINIPPPCG